MNLTRQLLTVLVLAAWAAPFAQADARARGGKHPGNAAGHVGTHHPAGVANGRRNVSPAAPAPVRNAIGVVTRPAAVGTGTAAKGTGAGANAVVVEPHVVGAHVGQPASVPAGAGRIGTTTSPVNAVRAVPSAPPAHAGGINGTGMGQRSNTLGTIGGPAKVATGITGTGIQKKK